MSSFAITWSPIVFGFALFHGSALLFLLQPMLGRTMAPLLGGNPLAWKACLVFFQATLLAGYVYADLLHRFRGLRWQPWLQMSLMALAVTLCFAGMFGDHRLLQLAPRLDSLETWPIVSSICLLIVVIGFPYFVLSAVGPLTHRWFAHLDHPKASDPYYLFVASNFGGLSGLIVYVLIIEPNAPLSAQWLSWKLAFTALTVMIGLVALCAWRSPRNPELEPPEQPSEPNAPPLVQLVGRGPATWPRCAYWLAASALPVALLMGLTDYLTLDLAPAPILWTIPIAIYLVAFSQAFARFSIYDKGSFVVKLIVQLLFGICLGVALACLIVSLLNFDHPGDPLKGTPTVLCVVVFGMLLLIPGAWLNVLQPLSALVVIFLQANVFQLSGVFMPTLLLYLACYYFTIRLCFNLLASDRPVASAVTTYYRWIGLGGLAGGLFQLAIAPLLFRTGYLEFAFASALACLLRPAWLAHGWTDWLVCMPLLSRKEERPQQTKFTRAFDLLLPIGVVLIAMPLFLLRAQITDIVVAPNQQFLLTGLRRLFADFPLALALLVGAVLIARPVRFGLTLAGIVTISWIGRPDASNETLLARQRTPFGMMQIVEHKKAVSQPGNDPPMRFTERSFMHGTTHHGSCITEPSTMLRHPTTYYHRKGPVGQVMRNLDWFGFEPIPFKGPGPEIGMKNGRDVRKMSGLWLKDGRDNAKDDARIAASIVGLGASGAVAPITAAWSEPPYAFVGLGPGSLFTYAHPYQWVDAYELDPVVIALSEGEAPVFHYYQSAQKRGVHATLHAGDGRRSLAKAGHENFYHALFVDAFNSNAMPTHLLTRQAIETYFQKLVPDGVVCVHTSNRNLELARVLEQVARRLDIAMATLQTNVDDNDAPTLFGSEWVVLARSKEVLRKWDEGGAFEQKPKERQFGQFRRHRDLNALVWTDEHASQFAAVRDGQPIFNFIYGMLGLLLAFALIMALIEIVANSAAAPSNVKPRRAAGRAASA